MILLKLYYEFFVTGLFMFGGGLAAIPFLQRMSERTGWFTHRQLMDMIAISEATPGPIGLNMATYAGYTVAGIPGGAVASLGLLTPSIIIALIVARLLARFKESPLVQSAFYGLRPASLGLIAAAGLTVLRFSVDFMAPWAHSGGMNVIFDNRSAALAAVLFVLVYKVKAHPLIFMAGSALAGILVL